MPKSEKCSLKSVALTVQQQQQQRKSSGQWVTVSNANEEKTKDMAKESNKRQSGRAPTWLRLMRI